MADANLNAILLEICIASVEDALAAQAGGADRLELNCALALGGLSPSLGLLRQVMRTVTLPVIAMARPRSGGFCYSASEFTVLQRDVELALENGVAGVAFGILTPEGQVDLVRCWQVIRQIGEREAVFHRAFDVAADPSRALDQLIGLGVCRVMTSGQEPTALDGAELIRKLLAKGSGRIEVLPASGINPKTVTKLLKRTGCDQVHASLRMKRCHPAPSPPSNISFGGARFDEYEATDPAAVREMRDLLDR
jgi:copper homeostasis protein